MAKVRIAITLPKELVEWIDEKVKERIYASRSHCIEVLIREKMKAEGKIIEGAYKDSSGLRDVKDATQTPKKGSVPPACMGCDLEDLEAIRECIVKRTMFLTEPCPRERALTS